MNAHFTGSWYGAFRFYFMLKMPGDLFRLRAWHESTGVLLLANIVVFFCTFWSPLALAVEESAVLDHQVKAAMLYKFLGYTEWPNAAFTNEEVPYRIFVLGSGVVADELLDITATREVNGRSIEVFPAASDRQLNNPHLVFVGHAAEKYLPRLAQLAEQQSFLIVTEREDGLIAGSTINLRLINGRIGFDVSLVGAQKCNLRLSARLLSVAASVEQEGR